jgi:hypothetical protein
MGGIACGWAWWLSSSNIVLCPVITSLVCRGWGRQFPIFAKLFLVGFFIYVYIYIYIFINF